MKRRMDTLRRSSKDFYRDRVVWITGASRGIGKALALEASRLGAKVILSARSVDSLTTVREQIGDAAAVLPMDLTDVESLPDRVQEATALFGGIDVLVNNAGVSQRSYFHETSLEVIRRLIDVNFTGAAVLTRLVLPDMYARRSGTVVVVSSVMGKFSTPLRSLYCASKAALHGCFDAVAVEAKQYGVRITVVVPGWVRTDISARALSADGSPHEVMDPSMARAKGPEVFAGRILRAVARGRHEVYIALSGKTRLGLLLKAVFPRLLRFLLRRAQVT